MKISILVHIFQPVPGQVIEKITIAVGIAVKPLAGVYGEIIHIIVESVLVGVLVEDAVAVVHQNAERKTIGLGVQNPYVQPSVEVDVGKGDHLRFLANLVIHSLPERSLPVVEENANGVIIFVRRHYVHQVISIEISHSNPHRHISNRKTALGERAEHT